MKTIIIHEEYASDYVTRPAGEKLRKQIIEISKTDTICLDFKTKKIASVSFFDESLGKLAEEGWDKVKFKEKIKLKDIYKFDAKILEGILKDWQLI